MKQIGLRVNREKLKKEGHYVARTRKQQVVADPDLQRRWIPGFPILYILRRVDHLDGPATFIFAAEGDVAAWAVNGKNCFELQAGTKLYVVSGTTYAACGGCAYV